jgi:DNA-directed RNA polymerase specialized sigma24 family protein
MEPQTSRTGLQDGSEIPASRATSEQAANDSMFVAAVNAAKTRAYRAAVTAGLSPTEREDLYQEILLDIYERKGQYDPSRGAPGTFTGLVSTHRTADFLNARKADKQKLVFAEPEYVDTLEVVTIDRAIHGYFSSQPSANDEDGGHIDSDHHQELLTDWDGDDDLFSNSSTQRDLLTALAYMSDEQRSLFDLLAAHQDVPAAAKASGMSSATFYRRVDDLRMHLRMFGIRPAA